MPAAKPHYNNQTTPGASLFNRPSDCVSQRRSHTGLGPADFGGFAGTPPQVDDLVLNSPADDPPVSSDALATAITPPPAVDRIMFELGSSGEREETQLSLQEATEELLTTGLAAE